MSMLLHSLVLQSATLVRASFIGGAPSSYARRLQRTAVTLVDIGISPDVTVAPKPGGARRRVMAPAMRLRIRLLRGPQAVSVTNRD